MSYIIVWFFTLWTSWNWHHFFFKKNNKDTKRVIWRAFLSEIQIDRILHVTTINVECSIQLEKDTSDKFPITTRDRAVLMSVSWPWVNFYNNNVSYFGTVFIGQATLFTLLCADLLQCDRHEAATSIQECGTPKFTRCGSRSRPTTFPPRHSVSCCRKA